jgi:hypothetical protein
MAETEEINTMTSIAGVANHLQEAQDQEVDFWTARRIVIFSMA